MEVKYNDEELKVIENNEGTLVPSEIKDRVITIGLKVNDTSKLNIFLEQLLSNQEVKDAIGAECVHVDFKSPISYDILDNLGNSLNEVIDAIKGNIGSLDSVRNFISAIVSDTLVNGPNEAEEAPAPIKEEDNIDIKEESDV